MDNPKVLILYQEDWLIPESNYDFGSVNYGGGTGTGFGTGFGSGA